MTDSLHRFLEFIANLDWKNLLSLAFMLEYFYFQFMRGQNLWENLTVHDLHSTGFSEGVSALTHAGDLHM